MTPDPSVTAARLEDLIYWLDKKYSRHHEEEDKEAADALREYAALRARSALADVGECERCKGEGYAVDDIDTQFRTSEYYPRCEDCNGTGKQPRPFTVEK